MLRNCEMTDFAKENFRFSFQLKSKFLTLENLSEHISRNELLGGPATRKEFQLDTNKSLPRDARSQIRGRWQHFG